MIRILISIILLISALLVFMSAGELFFEPRNAFRQIGYGKYYEISESRVKVNRTLDEYINLWSVELHDINSHKSVFERDTLFLNKSTSFYSKSCQFYNPNELFKSLKWVGWSNGKQKYRLGYLICESFTSDLVINNLSMPQTFSVYIKPVVHPDMIAIGQTLDSVVSPVCYFLSLIQVVLGIWLLISKKSNTQRFVK